MFESKKRLITVLSIIAMTMVPRISGAQSNLVLYTANTSDGLSGSYTEGEHELLFEAVRLPREVSVYSERDGRDYDIAIRFTDENDQGFFLLTEGHNYPRQWIIESEMLDSKPPIPYAMYELARYAAMSLEEIKFDTDIHAEQMLLVEQLSTFGNQEAERELDGDDWDLQEISELSALEDRDELNINLLASSTTAGIPIFRQTIKSYWKSAFFEGSPCDHTATQTYTYRLLDEGWSLYQTYIRCNHGTCPSDSSMNYYAVHYSPPSRTHHFHFTTPQECSGPYAMPHVCNNDTLLQQKNIATNSTYNTLTDSACMTLLCDRPNYLTWNSNATDIGDDDNVYGTISSSSDVDWYKVVIRNTGKANFWLDVPSGKNHELEIFDYQGGYLKGSYNGVGSDELITNYSVTEGEGYYIKVYGYSASSSSYNLRVKSYSDASDNWSDATNITDDGTVIAGTIAWSDDTDWYRIVITKTGTANFYLNVPDGVNYDMELYDYKGNYLGGSWNGANGANELIIGYEVYEGEGYYIRVYGQYGNNSFDEYTLEAKSYLNGTNPYIE